MYLQQGSEDRNTYDRDGQLRLVFEPVTFDVLFSAVFAMLRHASCDNGNLQLHMLEVIDSIGQVTRSPETRQELLRHINLIQAESQAGELIKEDRPLIQRSGEALLMNLNGTP